MKKLIIGALVASVILFIWQFLSWSMLNVHASEMQYTPHQDEIMEALNKNLEEGAYMLPNVSMDSPMEEQEKFREAISGKPWARIQYNKSFDTDMGMNMFRGWGVDFLAAFLLCWLLLKVTDLNFMTTIMITISIGLIGYLTSTYLNSIWFEGNTIGALIDVLVQWGTVGAWLGWWLNRK